MVVTKQFADLLSQPRVQGQILTTLSIGSFLQLIKPAEHGYLLVEAADGQRGYMPASSLSVRKDSDGYFLCGCDPSWFSSQKPSCDQETLRQQIIRSAESYLGVQYRWGGHSGSGTDCSGLTFMSYLMNGILIYRDAEIHDGYPVHAISIKFPGRKKTPPICCISPDMSPCTSDMVGIFTVQALPGISAAFTAV